MARLSAPRRSSALATPLPVINQILQRNGIYLRRGQSSLLAAAPGVGKTIFANNLAVSTPVESLYFSADSDEWTVKQRICSILTGEQLELVDQQLNDEAWDAWYTQVLARADHIDWCYQSDIEPEFIVRRLDAHCEQWGEYPSLIVVDNLADTYDESGDEWAALRSTQRELKRIARFTNAHVMGLHHVVGSHENGDKPIWLGDLVGKIGKIPEVVLGLYRPAAGGLNMTVAKNRGGKANMELQLGVDYARAKMGGF